LCGGEGEAINLGRGDPERAKLARGQRAVTIIWRLAVSRNFRVRTILVSSAPS
jgi:hypothetical protein